MSIESLARITSRLPASLHASIRHQLEFPNHAVNVEGVSETTLYDVYYRRLSSLFDPMRRNENVVEAKERVAKGIQLGLRSIVFRSSVDQALRGNVSFGVLNSLTYVGKKIMKFVK